MQLGEQKAPNAASVASVHTHQGTSQERAGNSMQEVDLAPQETEGDARTESALTDQPPPDAVVQDNLSNIQPGIL
jgi:hypothetical protein